MLHISDNTKLIESKWSHKESLDHKAITQLTNKMTIPKCTIMTDVASLNSEKLKNTKANEHNNPTTQNPANSKMNVRKLNKHDDKFGNQLNSINYSEKANMSLAKGTKGKLIRKGTHKTTFINLTKAAGIIKRTAEKKTSPKISKERLASHKLGPLPLTKSVGGRLRDVPEEPIAADTNYDKDEEKDLVTKLLPNLCNYCTREQATIVRDEQNWIRLGFTNATPTAHLSAKDVLAEARRIAEQTKHHDWASGQDPRYGYGEIEILSEYLTADLLLNLKSPNYQVHYMKAGAMQWGMKTTYMGVPTNAIVKAALPAMARNR